MIDFKDKYSLKLMQEIENQGYTLSDTPREGYVYDIVAIQTLIDNFPEQMPDLLPVQFNFLLAKYGFDDAIDSLLIALKNEDIDKYAMYKAYLGAARFYEFDKALIMFNEILDKFAAINPALALSESQLRAMWLEASQV